MNTDLRKKTKNDFEKDFFQVDEECSFLEKLRKLLENIEILNLSRQKEEDIETRFDTSNYELHRPLPKG